MPSTCFFIIIHNERYQGPFNSSTMALDLIFEIAIIGHRFNLLLSIPKSCGYVNLCCVVIDGGKAKCVRLSWLPITILTPHSVRGSE